MKDEKWITNPNQTEEYLKSIDNPNSLNLDASQIETVRDQVERIYGPGCALTISPAGFVFAHANGESRLAGRLNKSLELFKA